MKKLNLIINKLRLFSVAKVPKIICESTKLDQYIFKYDLLS